MGYDRPDASPSGFFPLFDKPPIPNGQGRLGFTKFSVTDSVFFLLVLKDSSAFACPDGCNGYFPRLDDQLKLGPLF